MPPLQPSAAAAGIDRLTSLAEVPEEWVIENPEWDVLYRFGEALSRVRSGMGRAFLEELGRAQLAIATNDLLRLGMARKCLALIVGELAKTDLIQIREVSKREGDHLLERRFADRPHLFTRELLTPSQPFPKNDKTQEWPVGSGRILVPHIEGWERVWRDGRSLSLISIGEKTFLAQEEFTGLAPQNLLEVSGVFDELIFSAEEEPLDPESLPWVLETLTTDPQISRHIRFPLMVEQGGRYSYWVAVWVKNKIANGPAELFVLVSDRGGENKYFATFRDFVELYLLERVTKQEESLVHFAPVLDLHEAIQRESKRLAKGVRIKN